MPLAERSACCAENGPMSNNGPRTSSLRTCRRSLIWPTSWLAGTDEEPIAVESILRSGDMVARILPRTIMRVTANIIASRAAAGSTECSFRIPPRDRCNSIGRPRIRRLRYDRRQIVEFHLGRRSVAGRILALFHGLDIDYSNGDHSVIGFHANKGLTFDLAVLSTQLEDLELALFADASRQSVAS